MPVEPVRSGRRSFGPVVLVGLAAAGLATVGAGRAWFLAEQAPGGPAVGLAGAGAQAPLAVSLGLVCLAAWGTVLVTRGRVRRLLAWLGLAAALALLASWAWAWGSVPDAVREDLESLGAADVAVGPSGWYWLSGVGALLATVSAAAGVRLARTWPEMGRRYDAPSGPSPGGPDPADASNLDLWRALDEGRDPTSGGQ